MENPRIILLCLTTSGAMKHHLQGWSIACNRFGAKSKVETLILQKGIFNACCFLRKISELRIKNKDLVIVVNGEYNPLLLAINIYLQIVSANWYITWHDVTPHIGSFKNKIYWWIARLNILSARRCIVHSHAYLTNRFLVNKQVIYLPLPRTNFPVPLDISIQKENSILFFGRIEKYKGLERIVVMFEHPTVKSPNIKFNVVGRGSVAYLNQLRILNNCFINYYGELDDENLAAKIMASKAIVMPYIHCSQSINPYWAEHYSVPLIVSKEVDDSMALSKYKGCYVFDSQKQLETIISQLNELHPFSGILADVDHLYEDFIID